MYWTLSEFLNVFEFRSQCWCFVNVANSTAIHVPHSDVVHFYTVTEGEIRISGIGSETIELRQGEVVFILSGGAHALRHQESMRIQTIPLLQKGGYVDIPPSITLGNGPIGTRMLAGRLVARWPCGQRPRGLPSFLKLDAQRSLIGLEKLFETAKADGAAAVLTRSASLLFVDAFRRHPQCQALFSQSGQLDPIARAQQFIELHPFQRWTVEILARKVGMGRSNFAARFAEQTGKTPIDLLTEERMKHAAEFLEKTNLKIAEVSERVGYRSEAAFHHRFSSYYGMSPGQLRRQRREMAVTA